MSDMSAKSERGRGAKYRKIPNISSGLIELRKHLLGGLYSGGGLIFGGHFVLVSVCQDVKNLLLYQQNVDNIGRNDLF